MKKHFFFTWLFLFLFTCTAFAETVIDRVDVNGNRRIPRERIEKHLVKAGTPLNLEQVDASIRAIIDTGLFLDAKTDLDVEGAKVVLTYILKERPLINKIYFEGNREISSETLTDKLPLKEGEPYDVAKVQRALTAMIQKYEEEDLFNVKITSELVQRKNNAIDIVFTIDEGVPARLYNIIFKGNKAISRDELMKNIESNEKKFWSFLSSSGNMTREAIMYDQDRIRAQYLIKGYVKAKVSDPDIVVYEDGKKMDVTFNIEEGEQYRMGDITVSGNIHRTADEIIALLSVKKGELFDYISIQESVSKITESFTEIGYAYADVYPETKYDEEKKIINVTVKVEEGTRVDIGRILIAGNDKTRDRIIRREFQIGEGDIYNGKAIRESKKYIQQTGYFGGVRLREKRADNDTVDLMVDVEEQATGMFTFGAAFSSVDGLLGTMQVTQNNLFGYGYETSVKAEVGSSRTDYTLSFTNPMLFDTDVSFGFDIYDTMRSNLEYDKHAVGAAVRVGHALIPRKLRAFYRLSYDKTKIFNLDDDASEYIITGENITISFTPTLAWQSVDNGLDPKKGTKAKIFAKYAGGVLGGDEQYVKSGIEGTVFYPLFWKFVGMIHTELGHLITTDKGRPEPTTERFRLGGMNSVRGFESGSISPTDSEGYYYGGNKYFLTNVEVTFPISEESKLKGVFFTDLGQVYDNDEAFFSRNTRESAGFGFRWYSPMGPLRLEYGQILDRQEGEDMFRWDFSIGGMF